MLAEGVPDSVVCQTACEVVAFLRFLLFGLDDSLIHGIDFVNELLVWEHVF